MTEQEIRDKLKLTKEQEKAFVRMKRALRDFENAGGRLVGSNEFQYAMNGEYFVDAHDSENSKLENYISLDDAELDSIRIQDPFNDASPYIEVRE